MSGWLLKAKSSRACTQCPHPASAVPVAGAPSFASTPSQRLCTMRIVVCGDASVGKLSLVKRLVKDDFTAVPVLLPPVTISKGDFESLNPDLETDSDSYAVSPAVPTSTTLVDTAHSDHPTLNRELKLADVILLVYCDHYTYERILLYWMPRFRASGVNLPIVVCANKADMLRASDLLLLNADEFLPLVNDYKEIEACVRCSAKTKLNVVEAFYLCQRAVTHPMLPIFDSKEGSLKPACVKALKRIFFLCDADQDGVLSFSEFSALHFRCFGKHCTEKDYDEIVQRLSDKIRPPEGTHGISESAFILLNKAYAEHGRHETIWGILRAFRYTDSLSISDKVLYPKIDVPPTCSVELSPIAYKFFVDLFLKFDKDNDGGLSDGELAQLFLPTPGVPKLWTETQFPKSIVRNEEGFVTLQGWLAQWNLTTYLDFKTTLEYLAYLGFEGSSVKAIKVTKARKLRQKKGKVYRGPVSDRNVFHCIVLGAPKVGKTSLLESFIHGSYSDVYLPTITPKVCVKDIDLHGGKQCYLILEELGELEPAVLENQKRLDQCDVVCYAYDSSDPELFQYLLELRQKFALFVSDIPSVFAALKADLDKQQQRSDIQPETYTRDLFLGSPLHISSSWPSTIHELLIQLVDAAKVPSTATPGLETHPQASNLDDMKHVIVAGGAISVVAMFLLWIFRSAQRHEGR